MLALLLRNGATNIRTHCNVDPIIGLGNLEATLAALETYKIGCLVESLLFRNMDYCAVILHLVKDAMRMGAHLVGVDPATVDNDIEKSLHTIMDI